MRNLFIVAAMMSSLTLTSCGERKAKIRIHTLGDSTMENQNPDIKDQRGWPQMLGQFLTDEAEVINHGKSGTSSKSFYNNGYWEKARKSIKGGDYVIIQFAHNDEKHGGFDGETGTLAKDSFRIYLSRYVNEVRELGANPVIASGVVRKMYDRSGRISRRGAHDLGEYVYHRLDNSCDPADTISFNYTYNARYVADSLSCPFIDMSAMTKRLADSVGMQFATEYIYSLPKDGTHFGAPGAALFSRIAVNELKKSVLPNSLCKPEASLLVNPVRCDYGNIYMSMDKITTVDIVRLDTKAGTPVKLMVEHPFSISSEKDGEYGLQMVLVNKGGAVEYDKVYVKAKPAQGGDFAGVVSVSSDDAFRRIVLEGQCSLIGSAETVRASYALTDHPQAKTTGAVKATELSISSLKFEGMVWNDNLSLKESMNGLRRRVYCAGAEVWLDNEVDVDYDRYVEFALEIAPDLRLNISKVSLTAGGGARYRVAYSDTPDFVTAHTLFERAAGTGHEMMRHVADTGISAEGKIYFRVYPWVENPKGNEKICISDILIEGEQKQ